MWHTGGFSVPETATEAPQTSEAENAQTSAADPTLDSQEHAQAAEDASPDQTTSAPETETESTPDPVAEQAKVIKAAVDAARSEERATHVRDLDRRIKVERENATRKYAADLRRQAGNSEHVRSTMTAVVKAAKDADDGDLDEVSAQAAQGVIQNNQQFALRQVLEDIPKAIMAQYNLPVEAREAALDRHDSGDPDGYVRALVEGAVAVEHAKRLQALTVGDVPKDSAFWSNFGLADAPEGSKVRKDLDAWKAGELAAADLERREKTAAVATTPKGTEPSASGGKLTLNKLKKMTPAQVSAEDKSEVDAVLAAG
jgi:hypothetical protein